MEYHTKTSFVVGIDLSGNPTKNKFVDFLPAAIHARSHGLMVTVHAGEVDNPSEVDEILRFGPDRLGHALFLNPAQRELVARRRIPVEICPTSNAKTLQLSSLKEHPTVPEWMSRNHPFCVCTDDTGVFGTTLSEEYFHLAAAFELSEQDLAALAMNSVSFIFQDADAKQRLTNTFAEICAGVLKSRVKS